MTKPNPQVDGLLRKQTRWKDELSKLREIALACDLKEEVKWRHACYTFEGKNIAILGGFKEYCIINFMKGVLLKDPKKILVLPGENSQASRFVRFTDVKQITRLAPVLKAYLREAVEVEKRGLKVTLKKITDYKIPEELQQAFEENPDLKVAFRALTPGRQRMYLMHVSSAKQSTTRVARVEKCVPRILNGKGLDDE